MSQSFLVLPGPKALSQFRVNTLIQEIEKKLNHQGLIEEVASQYTHYVSLKKPLNERQLELLKILLTYDNPVSHNNELNEQLIRFSSQGAKDETGLELIQVLPRPGTISPWSSKATDISQICGLGDYVERIERGLSLLIKFKVVDGNPPINMAGGDELTSVFDRMTQKLYINDHIPKYDDLFAHHEPKPLVTIDLLKDKNNLFKANSELGLALDKGEIEYLTNAFINVIGRNPTDVELFMFAQVNSEHCRHKIFNADWTIDGEKKDKSLFKMIRNTHEKNPQYTISAYSDNAAVFDGPEGYLFAPDFVTKQWKSIKENVQTLVKVETHNHPTAVSPFAGAATGSGGEIRDEGAVGRGSKSKAGLSGFTVSDLNIPDLKQPWERDIGKPNHIASSLDIMIEAPIGSAAFNNEFGRPAINGYFRTLTTEVENSKGEKEIRGFHKPIMLAGGMGAIRPELALKNHKITPGAKLIVLGGQSMLIGLGGGAASSISSGEGSAELDFASVQRGNPEMQRRAQQVIDTCVSLGANGNPIQSIHDVGAGGLSNALPELVHDNDLGAIFELRSILSLEKGMSPMEIWCNESQERYVLGVAPENLELFSEICKRERAPFAVVGEATTEKRLVLNDSLLQTTPIDLEMSVLFGKPPKMSRETVTADLKLAPFSTTNLDIDESISRVLQLPSVGSKSFLITIGDRFITGLVDRDQMVGPWQVPVADVGVTATSLGETVLSTGEAMAMGEKPNLALISANASAKMCVAESLLNLFAADVSSLQHVKLSANWMSAANHPGEGAKLYEAVQAIGLDLCPELGISIPVGKDSMSMSMKWDDKQVIAPLALTVTAFAPVDNTSKTWTPQLIPVEDTDTNAGIDTILVLVDLAAQVSKSLGGSALAQVYQAIGDSAPTVHSNSMLKSFLQSLVVLHKQAFPVLAYHDRSDGGLIATILEMAFAGRCGLDIGLEGEEDKFTQLFNEELGAVFQIKLRDLIKFKEIFKINGIDDTYIKIIGKPDFTTQAISISYNGAPIYSSTRGELQQLWSKTSYHIQKMRDNPFTSKQEYDAILDDKDPGISYHLTFNPSERKQYKTRPKVAILREQGVNSQQEMAWSFQQAGFDVFDVTMFDILEGKTTLDDFVGLAACGGFSYGDVLGAGAGWAKSVLFNDKARSEFKKFFQDRQDTFAFGACNGCQFFSRIASELIPGTEHWPTFERNLSEQYEARFVMVEVDSSEKNNSIFLQSMKGSKLPIAVAHGEGRAQFKFGEDDANFKSDVIRYVDNYGNVTESYPFNPNGSPRGIAGISSANGRVLAMMPHPERVTRKEANSFYPHSQGEQWEGYGPWVELFKNAREWVGQV